MENQANQIQTYSHLNTALRKEFQNANRMIIPRDMYSNLKITEESFYVNDSDCDSDDSYVSVDGPPPLLPPINRMSLELPFSSHTLQEHKKLLKNVPLLPPKPNKPIMVYDSLSPKNSLAEINMNDYSVYEEIPDCGKEASPSVITSPPPPPRTYKLFPSPNKGESTMSLHCIAPNEEYIPTSDEMCLGDFVSKSQNDFPVRIRVSRGFYGTSDQWSISEDEYFNIHFIKKTKVVSTWDGCFGNYNIPINSSAMFGFLYMENDDISKGINGYNFPTAGDILEASNPPPIVKVKSHSAPGKSSEQSVRVGDLLIIQGNKGRLRKMLKCLDVKTGEKKLLPTNCKGNFTTCPRDTQLFLPEIIEHFKLPANFVMYINTDSVLSSEEMSFSHRVQLSHCSIESSLIATQLDRRISDDETPPIIEIPMDLDIGIELVISRDDEAAQLYEETGRLYETLDISSIQTIPSNVSSFQSDPATAEALVACHQKNKNVGIEIQQPPRYFKKETNGPPLISPSSLRQNTNSYSQSVPVSSVRQNISSYSESVPVLSPHSYPINKGMEDLKFKMDKYAKELKKISDQVSQLNTTQESMMSMYSNLEEELRNLQKTPNHSTSSVKIKKSKAVASSNQKHLKFLSQDEIMKILKNLGLQQYQPLFRSNNITGKQMSTMTEGDLKHLGVSVEHLCQIMNVIEGTITPQSVLCSTNV